MRTPIAFLIAFLMTASLMVKAQVSVYSNNKTTKVSYNKSNGVGSFNVEIRGKIEMTDDDKDIKSMSSDGYLEVTKTVFGSRRSIVITPQANGLKREYYEGRTAVAFEPEGRKWLSEILPELLRSTTIGAESRVNRFYRQGGSKAVVEEIGRLESDHVKAHYANVLMDLNLPEKDYAFIINKVAESIDSDHYLTEFLKGNMNKFLQSKEATEAVFTATKKMESDHYKTEVIKEALRSGPATLESVKIIMEATSNMESDHYKTEVMTNLLRQNNLNDAVISEMINGTKSIESDHYRTVVLTKALEKPGLSATSYQRVLESVKDIDSDHYKTQVLTTLLQNNLTSDAQNNLISISTSIESDHYFTQVAAEIMKKQNVNDDTFQKLLEAIGNGTDSDHYTAQFLQSALERPNLTKQNIQAILNATDHIDSDHYRTEVLTRTAPKIKQMNDASLKDAYRAAAKKIESETYYGRALRAID
jgi:hypothetical protein